MNQIDHVLVEKRFVSDILDMRNFREVDCDTDHYLVKAKFRCKISKSRKEGTQEPAEKYDTTKLKSDPEVATALNRGFDQ